MLTGTCLGPNLLPGKVLVLSLRDELSCILESITIAHKERYHACTRPMKIAFVTSYDARDRASWNGCGYYQARCLQASGSSVDYIGPLVTPHRSVRAIKRSIYDRFTAKTYTWNRDRLVVRNYARQISTKLRRSDADIVFSGISPGSQPVAYLECKQPIVIWTDATLASVVNWYPFMRKMCQETVRDGLTNERAALERASLVIYSSDFAAQEAVRHYQLPPSKVRVVPFGPILDCDRKVSDITEMIGRRPRDKCRLLFPAYDWFGKGGDIAYLVAENLNRHGLETELIIAGSSGEFEGRVPKFVKALGSISKNSPAGEELLDRLFTEAHFVILPSRFDACPHALAEANSYGVPCLSTTVGGIPTAIRDGVNGRMFPLEADVSEYCTFISELMNNRSRYEELALSAFCEYETRLNWRTAGETVSGLLATLAQQLGVAEQHSQISGQPMALV